MPLQTIREQRELALRRKNLRRFLRSIAVCAALLVLCAFWGNYWVKASSQGYIYRNMKAIPPNETGLLLGTNKWIAKGVKNEYFVNRTEAAAMLYHNGKIKNLILSGDSSAHYNEPRDMSNALLALGVPSTAITLDYAGYRTYDSVLRCLKKYGKPTVTIISQTSHNYRAVFIARHLGMRAIAFSAQAPAGVDGKPNYREFWARLNAIFDVYIFKAKSPAAAAALNP